MIEQSYDDFGENVRAPNNGDVHALWPRIVGPRTRNQIKLYAFTAVSV